MRCEHEHDDGAYVLGALSPHERAVYERHLATCSFCREAVADISALPGLLGRVDPAEFAKLLDPTLTGPPVRRRRRRTGVRIAASLAAAVVVVLIAGFGVVITADRGPAVIVPAAAMLPVGGPVPLSAQVDLAGAAGGTKVTLTCVNRGDASYTVRLMAFGGAAGEPLGSWNAPPGKEFSMSGVTHLGGGDLSRLELVRDDGTTLLAYDVP